MSPPTPNPRRVAAGRLNRRRRRGLTVEGRERLRRSALAHRPWEHSTGPRTAAGKAKAAKNGKFPRPSAPPAPAASGPLADLTHLVQDMAAARRLATELRR
jgi:hypothetical protein